MDGSPVASVLDPVVLLVASLEELQRWIASHVLIQTVLWIRIWMGSDSASFYRILDRHPEPANPDPTFNIKFGKFMLKLINFVVYYKSVSLERKAKKCSC